MYCGTDVSREVVREEPGPGTGESIYTTSSGYRFIGWCGWLPRGFYWRQTANSNTTTYGSCERQKSKEEKEIEEFLEELQKGLKKKDWSWWMRYQADPPYRPRFREVQVCVRPDGRARSNPRHLRARPWETRRKNS